MFSFKAQVGSAAAVSFTQIVDELRWVARREVTGSTAL
jgi:hypothetical protein